MRGHPFKWLELIRVRSSAAACEAAAPSLRRDIEQLGASIPDADFLFLHHALYEGDLAIAIVWRTREQPKRTQVGVALASELEHLGSIDHAVWTPTTDFPQPQGAC